MSCEKMFDKFRDLLDMMETESYDFTQIPREEREEFVSKGVTFRNFASLMDEDWLDMKRKFIETCKVGFYR